VPLLSPTGEVIGLQGVTQDVTAMERSGRLQRAIAELGRIGLGGDDLEELLAQTRRLVVEGLDVESAHVEAPGDRRAALDEDGAALRVPIRGPQGPYGTLVAATTAPRRFAEEEVAFLEGAAHVVGEAIARREAAREIAELSASRGRLVAQAIEAEARARRGISDRLHDGPLQDLLAAGHDLYGLGDGPDAVLAQERLGDIARELREVTAALHPTVLRYGGLAAALHAVAGRHASAGGWHARVIVRDGATGVHDELLLSLARQLLADVGRRTGVSEVAVDVRRLDDELRLELTDDAPFEPGRVAPAAAAERIAAVGGRLDAGPGPRGGTRITVGLPVS
jgi:signal transduction histidine kinase